LAFYRTRSQKDKRDNKAGKIKWLEEPRGKEESNEKK